MNFWFSVWGLSSRLLPCFHTICEECLNTLTQRIPNIINCPVCQRDHTCENTEKFPKNEYIIEYIREMKRFTNAQACPKCSAHGKELSLYCTDSQCKTTICQVCLIKDHIRHGGSVVDISEDWEEKKELLLSKVISLTKEVENTRNKYVKKKEQITEYKAKCIAAIESRKRELEDMIRKVSDYTPEVTETIDENVKTMDGFLTNLEDIRKSNTTTYGNVQEKLESVAEIERCFQMIVTNEGNFEYFVFCGNGDLRKLKLVEKRGDGSDDISDHNDDINETSGEEGEEDDKRIEDVREDSNDTDKTSEEESEEGDKRIEDVCEKEARTDKISKNENDEGFLPRPCLSSCNVKRRQLRFWEESDTDTEEPPKTKNYK